MRRSIHVTIGSRRASERQGTGESPATISGYACLTGRDLRRERRLAGRLASVRVIFSETYEDTEYAQDEVDRLYSEIEDGVNKRKRSESFHLARKSFPDAAMKPRVSPSRVDGHMGEELVMHAGQLRVDGRCLYLPVFSQTDPT